MNPAITIAGQAAGQILRRITVQRESSTRRHAAGNTTNIENTTIGIKVPMATPIKPYQRTSTTLNTRLLIAMLRFETARILCSPDPFKITVEVALPTRNATKILKMYMTLTLASKFGPTHNITNGRAVNPSTVASVTTIANDKRVP